MLVSLQLWWPDEFTLSSVFDGIAKMCEMPSKKEYVIYICSFPACEERLSLFAGFTSVVKWNAVYIISSFKSKI